MSQEEAAGGISSRFKDFMAAHNIEFHQQIHKMIKDNNATLEIHYEVLKKFDSDMGLLLMETPRQVLEIMERSAKEYLSILLPEHLHNIRLIMTCIPVYNIHSFRDEVVERLVSSVGVVTRLSEVFQQLLEVTYVCNSCASVLGPFLQNSSAAEVDKVASCPHCHSEGPFTVGIQKVIYNKYQKLTLQKLPRLLPPTNVPEGTEVILLDELIGCASLGDEIQVTGIYTKNYDTPLDPESYFHSYAKVIVAKRVVKEQSLLSPYILNNNDMELVLQLSQDPQIKERIISSFAPSIAGLEYIKTVITLAMFGGDRNTPSRGDINVLLLGDPDSPISQFFECVEHCAPKAVRALPAALKAMVHHNPVVQDWTLEDGALVLADKGTCLIDGLDQVNDANSQAILKSSQAGISEDNLKCRCSIIAGATPIGGRYESSRTFKENVALNDDIVSQFDVLCVVKEVVDETMSKVCSMVELHSSAYTDKEDATSCEMKDINVDRASVPAPVKQLKSLERLAKAHARMHLREEVNSEDFVAALRVLSVSFISSQKLVAQECLVKALASLDDYLLFANENSP
ncbi:DNA replication licensing factor Mcm2 [Artemisia annua]|uniref:DNA replication licensing factor MCM2 n=1 Tax=Artemisia annua TaxID=35608 RepID=A0A2U1MBX8_ARTAN|nr:DNA replication licensing factor Mcm2 [Artemisia annua]